MTASSPFRAGQPVRVTLAGVDRSGEVVCPNADGTVRVRVGGVSRDVAARLVAPVRAAASDRWAELHGAQQ